MPPATLVTSALFGLALMGVGLILVAALLLRRVFSGRTAATRHREANTQIALLSAALQEAVGKLKAQERATAARAEASERRAGQIVDELPSGLLVVNRAGIVETINPAARRILDIDQPAAGAASRSVLAHASSLADLIDDVLGSSKAIVRRTVTIGSSLRRLHLGVSDDARRRRAGCGCLPVYGPHGSRRAGRPVAAQRSVGALGRAHCRAGS